MIRAAAASPHVRHGGLGTEEAGAQVDVQLRDPSRPAVSSSNGRAR